MEYDTVSQLRDAYAAGRLTEPLVIGNGVAQVYGHDGGSHAPVFQMHPADLLDQALSVLGIPHENL